jgi:hypothetical protein
MEPIGEREDNNSLAPIGEKRQQFSGATRREKTTILWSHRESLLHKIKSQTTINRRQITFSLRLQEKSSHGKNTTHSETATKRKVYSTNCL